MFLFELHTHITERSVIALMNLKSIVSFDFKSLYLDVIHGCNVSKDVSELEVLND